MVSTKVLMSDGEKSVAKYLMSDKTWAQHKKALKGLFTRRFAPQSNKMSSFTFVAKKHDHV